MKDDFRTCKKCLKEKPLMDFQKDKKCKFGYSYKCKNCAALYCKSFYANSPQAKKKSNLKVRYGLELERYAEMVIQQGDKCAICGQNKQLVVDHCHKTNRIRSLLCHKCNTSLGCLEHFIDNRILMTALAYLQS